MRSTRVSTWPCRPAPAPASRSPIWCLRLHVPSPPTNRWWFRRRRSRCNASSSTATCPRSPIRWPAHCRADPTFALLKGRGNYLCLNKIHNGSAVEPDDRPQEELFDAAATTALGRDVQRLTAWSSTTETGDRDELTPGVPDRSWAQVSVSARECIGAARCPFGTDCFAEKARDTAGHADVVVTNHALLAIDAISDAAVLPEHRLLVVDEAHELVDRVTSVATAELSNATLSAANRRVARLVEPELAQRLEAATATFSSAIHDATPGRIDRLDDEMTTYLTALRDAASRARSAIDMSPSDPKAASARAEAVTALTDISDTASRIVASFVPAIPDRDDVVWLDHEDRPRQHPGGRCGWHPCRWRACCAAGCSSSPRWC